MRVSHPIFGVGNVLAERVTESGQTVMDIDFEARDCRRTLLADVLKIVDTAALAPAKKKRPARKSKSQETDPLLYEAQRPALLLDEVDSDEAHEIDAVGAG